MKVKAKAIAPKLQYSRIWSKGQLTIPKKIRDSLKIEDGRIVSILQIGDNILITPNRLVVSEARAAIAQILKEEKVSLDDLLEGLKEERKRYNKEKYGIKKK